MTEATGRAESVLSDLTLDEKAGMVSVLQSARDHATATGRHRVAHAFHAFAALIVLAQVAENATLDALAANMEQPPGEAS